MATLHVGEPVEGVEDAEDIDALRGGFEDEFADHIVGIGGVADGVGGAQQHLEADVGNGGAQLAEALPRVFEQEAHGDIERGAAPHFEAEEIGQAMRDEVRDGQHVGAAHACGQQGLMRVAKGGVGEEQAASGRSSNAANFLGPSSSSSCRVPGSCERDRAEARARRGILWREACRRLRDFR